MTDLWQPPWDEGVTISSFPLLARSIEAEVVVVGAGITGITTAYFLSEAGYDTVLIEKDRIGRGATGLTTAFLTQYIDTSVSELIKIYGSNKTKKVLGSHGEAIDSLERIINEEHIECDFNRCFNRIYSNSPSASQSLLDEQKRARNVGVVMDYTEDGKLPFKHHGYLEMPNQGKFHPLKYLAALVDILQKRGVRIYEQTEATEVEKGERLIVKTPNGDIDTQRLVVATYAPFNGELYFKKAFYTSYVIEASIPKDSIPEGIYEDTSNPYHYFRVDKGEDQDRLIIGGEDHRSDIPVNSSKSFHALEDYMYRTFVNIPYVINSRWYGPIIEPVDGLAYIGALNRKSIYYATGFSGNGMTYGIIAAKLITDLIRKKKNTWAELYAPDRRLGVRSLAYKGRDYAQELLGGAVKNTLRYRK